MLAGRISQILTPLWTLCALSAGCGRIGVELLAIDASTPADAGTPTECMCENPHGTAECRAGRCEVSCETGYASCDGRDQNGCETDISSMGPSCGACGVSCVNPNGATSCVEGVCVPMCAAQAGDCDGLAQNGCEERLNSAAHCGACGAACSNPHGTTTCADGSCAPSCEAGYASCDGDLNDGCETNVARDPMHCGDCNTTCDPSSQVCTDGVCMASTCPAGRADCDADRSDCETALGSPSDCAFCGETCSAASGSATCAAGTCAVSACNAGFGNCDGSYQNGCEAALSSTVAHCGRCDNPCTNAHGTVSCAASVCAPTCATGWGSCDANPQNGCETALDSLTHCGMCNRACTSSLSGATPSCSAGACAVRCLDGVYALRLSVNVNWSNTYIQSDSGTMVYWARLNLTQAGGALSGTITLCGLSIPDFQNSMVPERYGISLAATVFEQSIPSIAVSGTFSATPSPSFSLNRTALLMGATLADPINDSWPSLGQLDGTDHDNDGRDGMNVDYRSGSGYAYPPTTATYVPPPARARQSDLAARSRFQLGGNLTSCTSASGSANVSAIEQHTLGCRLDGGGNCNSTQYQHLDQNDPRYTPQSAAFSLSRLGNPGATVSCAAIRAALP